MQQKYRVLKVDHGDQDSVFNPYAKAVLERYPR